ncbi:MAG: MurT ligase domain-containing protein [Eubacteriales bacterium]|nr:MurT ligase domain-containing protein [Eubacteriales bacterium]
MSVRVNVAVWAGKFTTKVLKLVGSGGTSLPGKVVLKICPDILGHLAKNMKIICVTGTNGKTTTCHIIRDMIEANGQTVFCNDAGANLLGGVVSAFVGAASLSGKIKKDYALLECDEAALKSIVEHFGDLDVTAVVTNVFRDQLDRYGEVLTTVNKIRAGLSQLPNVRLVLNADCSLTTSLNDLPHKELYYFGVNGPLYEGTSSDISDAVYCIHCKTKYQYHYHTFGHLGGFYCEKCGYQRNEPDVALSKVIAFHDSSSEIEMKICANHFVTNQTSDAKEKTLTAQVMLPGGYNLYNALAATTIAQLIGLPDDKVVSVLGGLTTHFGRMEEVEYQGHKLHLVLVKNPAGFNEVLQFLIQQKPTGNIVFGLNDNYADGKDISWIYDVEFERLTQSAAGAKQFFFTGKRAYDMQLRLKYADFDTEKFLVEKDYKSLITRLGQSGEDTFLVLSYTCMLEFRDKLAEFIPLKKYES